ncbi:MAG TPA: DUF167 family protein [Candidatus Dormibacteraeota bacterium]|nr:DUF167 family protein [Candidatus Dormibacteraeota bacterium]
MPVEARLAVRLTPRGGRDAIEGIRDHALLVRVAAPPADGAANEALLRLLAAELDSPRTALRIASGAGSRRKVVAVSGDRSVTAVRRRWPDLLEA